ncbi:MAG: hypothetical protein FJ190_06990 [Gammaproteobacteria bacterium]|nr:hypothetical protein [Gammaproteobacteria bacterium]
MALHFDYALRLRSNSVKTPGLYGYAGVVVHRSASLASMYSFNANHGINGILVGRVALERYLTLRLNCGITANVAV